MCSLLKVSLLLLLVVAAKQPCSLVTSRTQHILAVQESCSEGGHKLILVLTLIRKISKKQLWKGTFVYKSQGHGP